MVELNIYLQSPMDSVINFLFVILQWAIVALVLVVLLIQIWDCLQLFFPQLTTYLPKRRHSVSYLTDHRNRQLQKQLLDLLNGDVAAAKRLLRQQRQLHQGKSDNWYLEKVIWDLERDRN